MKRLYGKVLLCALGLSVGYSCLCESAAGGFTGKIPCVQTREQVVALFPKTVEEIQLRVDEAMVGVQIGLDAILNQPADTRTFDSTVRAEDQLTIVVSSLIFILELTTMTHPDSAMRDAARQGMLKLNAFLIDKLSLNRGLYRAFCEYVHNQRGEILTPEQRLYLEKSLHNFELSGLGLPDAKLYEVKALYKELSEVGLQFETAINNSLDTIAIERSGLDGLEDEFIEGLPRNAEGQCILSVNPPTYHVILEHCKVAKTREAMWVAFHNRAYPKNEEVLKRFIALRGQLATLLGFPSFAHLSLVDQMAKSPERVRAFLEDLRVKSLAKYTQELELWTEKLPEGVSRTSSGDIYPWDLFYIKESYKKEHFSIDEQKLKEYFPVQRTLDALLSIYEQFLGLEFRQESGLGLWHEDVRYIAAYARDGKLLGHILLDLFPRDFKYSHACQGGAIPAVRTLSGDYYPAVIFIIANFPKETPAQPALLSFNSVSTFFHEFGHAMHALLGATDMAGLSGTSTPTDFVETPSQMFEEWLYDPAVLQRVSCHYKTGEPLDDATINCLCKLKSFESGLFVQGQSSLARFALDCFSAKQVRNVGGLMESVDKLYKPGIARDERDHLECAFGHLVGYGARYYSYLWSKIFAVDLFCAIKHEGLFDPAVGKRFATQVLGRGGSMDPELFMTEFLGRAPSSASFFNTLD